MRWAAICLCAALVADSVRAQTSSLVCGAPSADAHGEAHIIAAVVDGSGFVPARAVRVEGVGLAMAGVDALGRVDLSGFAAGAEIPLQVETAHGQISGSCADRAPADALRFVDVPDQARAGKGELKIGLTGALAAAATVRANVGEASVRHGARGVYVLYRPPAAKTPDLAIIEAAAEQGGRRFVARSLIPLHASVNLPGQSEPRSLVTVDLGGQRFGPVKADRRGRFEVRVDLPPGLSSASGESIDEIGNRGSQEIAIPVPPVHRLGALEVTPLRWRGQPLRGCRLGRSPPGTTRPSCHRRRPAPRRRRGWSP